MFQVERLGRRDLGDSGEGVEDHGPGSDLI